jgi:putative peptidoglycan lipid II flippase
MRRALSLGALSGTNVLVSFAAQWYVFTRIGPGRETDSLFAGMVVPMLVLAIVSGSLTHVLVPLLSGSRGAEFRRDGWAFFQGIALLFGAAAVGLGLSAPWWVPLTVPGFEAEALRLTVELVRIQLIGMVFTACTAVLWSANHARGRFIWAEASPVLAAVVTFPLLIVGLPRIGVAAAAWVLVLKYLLQMVLLLPILGPYQRADLRTPAAREAWRRIRPLLLGTSFYKTDQLVDRFLASMAAAGGLSILHLAQQMYAAGHQVMNAAIAAPLVPRMAQAAQASDPVRFGALWRGGERRLLLLTALVLAGLLLAGVPALTLLLGHGEFQDDQIRDLWLLMLALGGTWVGGALGQIFSAAFYAAGDTITPTRIGVIGFMLGIVLKVIGFQVMGVVGIALGTSAYFILNAVVLRLALALGLERRPIWDRVAQHETVHDGT